MMSLDNIVTASRNATLAARRNRREPFTVTAEDIADLKVGNLNHVNFPFLGDYVAPGWARTNDEPLFCDTSGFGAPNEPTLTLVQLAESLKPGFGYGTIERGQFQAYLACYRKVSK